MTTGSERHSVKRILPVTLLAAILSATPQAGSAPALTKAAVLLKSEIEGFGQKHGLSPVSIPGASGGLAMAFSAQARVLGALRLEPGDYTLLVRCYAPAGNADGFFVEIDRARTRRTAPIGRWGTLAYPFSVKKTTPVSISIIGQEPGMAVDQVAVVRGRWKDNAPKLSAVPGIATGGANVPIEQLPRLTLECRLGHLPDKPFQADASTVYLQNFDVPCAGVSGEHARVEGKWGKALNLTTPDGRFSVDARAMKLGPTGTVEWWVRPRPAQELWSDQGWHYFLHAKAKDGESLQVDLSRHPLTNLRLTASNSEGPYYTENAPGSREWTQVPTGRLDNTAWHHILLSWDVRGKNGHDILWLLVDGNGVRTWFPHRYASAGFARFDFANTPPDWKVPFLPMDGAIDDIRIQNVSVASRLAK